MRTPRHNLRSVLCLLAFAVLVSACSSAPLTPTAIAPASTGTSIPATPTTLGVLVTPTVAPSQPATPVNNPSNLAPTLEPSPAATSGASVPGGAAPRTITLADDGKTIDLQVGDLFVLDLGSDYSWQVTIDQPAIIGQAAAALHPGAPVYQARRPGRATLHATGNPPCLNSTPRCLLPSRLFQIQLVVNSSQPAAQTITLDDDGKTITLQVGQAFLLDLGDGFNWTVTVDDPSIVSRVPNITVVKGAQGVYRAQQAGSTTLYASGPIACPPLEVCPQLARAFRVQIVIQK